MKKGTKIAIIVAGIAFALGIILMVCSLAVSDFDFRNLQAPETEVTDYLILESFESVTTDILDCDIVIYPSDDDKCRVTCVDSENMAHSVYVSNGELVVKQHDTRRWFEKIGFFIQKKYVRIDLPVTQYEEFYLKTVSGDIYISDEFVFKGITLDTVSGDLKVSDISADSIKGSTISGEIIANDIVCSGDIAISTTSGDAEMSSVIAKGKLSIKTVSGDIELERCDGAEVSLKTTSGDIDATLLSPKDFDTDTVSGDAQVPISESGAGKCILKTTSGDIEVRVLN